MVQLLIWGLRSSCLFHMWCGKTLIELSGSSSKQEDAQSIHVYYTPSHTSGACVRFLNIDYRRTGFNCENLINVNCEFF